MAIIKKKTWPEYFEAVLNGKKDFDMRVADFDMKEGDTLILEEWNPKTKKYTGRKIEKKAGFVGKFDLNTFAQRELLEKIYRSTDRRLQVRICDENDCQERKRCGR